MSGTVLVQVSRMKGHSVLSQSSHCSLMNLYICHFFSFLASFFNMECQDTAFYAPSGRALFLLLSSLLMSQL